MNRYRVLAAILIGIIFVTTIGGCNIDIETPGTGIPVTYSRYQQIVDAVETAPPLDKVPRWESGDNTPDLPSDKWNINQYFSILTHLSMEEGYVLDWVYAYNGSGGYPTIYVRAVNDTPLKNSDEWSQAYKEKTLINGKMIVEDSEDGYFEYIVYHRIGGNFYLFWHSLLDDWSIVCDKVVLDTWEPNVYHDADLIKKAKKMDFKPVIELQQNTAKVSIVTYNAWSGFRRETYVIDRQRPNNIIDTRFETLIEHHANITY